MEYHATLGPYAPPCSAFRAPYTQDPCPPPPKQKVGATPPADSKGPLLKLAKPMLFVNGEFDAMCPGADLRDVARAMADVDMRAVALPVRCSWGGAGVPLCCCIRLAGPPCCRPVGCWCWLAGLEGCVAL